MAKPRKIRLSFRKNRETKARQNDLTRQYAEPNSGLEDAVHSERLSGKGELTRKRTVLVDESEPAEAHRGRVVLESLPGRVLQVLGLWCNVALSDGQVVRCATSRLLKTMSTSERHVVSVGDRVAIKISPTGEGMIERVDERQAVLSRTSRGRQHIIATNVDQVIIVSSLAEPRLKPGLIDRFLVTIEKAGLSPVICLTKVDLIEPADILPLAGVYAQLGYPVLLVSNVTGQGIPALSRQLKGRTSVFSGQSGVGKSTLLNAVDPRWKLATGLVSDVNQKGKHTTTSATMLPLSGGGFVVDTPGIRQFELWDVDRRELSGYFRDIRPFEHLCHFPNCTHIHEQDCAVKNAVGDGLIDLRRYESYVGLFEES